MPENQANFQQFPEETSERAPHLMGRSNTLAAFIFTEAVLASPIGLAAGAAIFQLIGSGKVSPETDFWLWFSVVGLGGPTIILAAIHSEASKKD